MSGAEHHATVDKGLKMKIKRKNVNNSKSDAKHEIVKGVEKMSSLSNENSSNSANGTQVDKVKQSMSGDKSPKVKGSHKKEKVKEKTGKGSDLSVSSVSTTLDAAFSQVSLDSKPGDSSKPDDPYDFDAKDDESIGFPIKKVKAEKNELSTSSHNHVGTETCSIGVATDPDCLGPCEPGTNVLLEGIVWQETENGVLVVNVTWRDKTYVGTLLDATKHEWAPPRFNCDSPVSDLDSRTPKGRAKRGRGSISTPVIEKVLEGRTLRKGRKGSSTFTAPPSPAKSDISTTSSVGLKRKGRPTEMEIAVSDSSKVKRSRSCSRGAPGDGSESPVPNFIECPEPNCNKKYKHMNGLRYHQSHAHSSLGLEGDEESRDMDNAEDSMLEDLDSNMGESCDNSSNNLKIDMDSIEDSESKRTDNEDSMSIDIVNVVKPTVKPSNEVKMDMDELSKKDNSFSSSATFIKPNIGSGTTFHAVISSSKIQSSDASTSTVSTSVLQTPICQSVVNVTTSSPQQSTRPITFAAISANSQSNELKTDFSSGKMEKLIKPKMMNRPIAPSNMIALSSNVTVTHTNLAPVATHAHVSNTTQFQPIQPKPTVLGDSSAVNQHLLGLKKDLKDKKMKHKKKLKEKDSNNLPQNVNIAAPKLIKPDIKKTETSSVIKVAPIMAKPLESIKKENVLVNKPVELDKEKSGLLIDKSYPSNVGVITAQVQPQQKVVDLSARTEQPSVVKVTPTLQVVTNESNKSNVNDDVQSPAYSDISDANEAGSPALSASPQIVDEKTIKQKDSQGASTANLENPPLNQYGIYGNYYNQSPYLLSPVAQGSPGSNIQKMQTNPIANKDRSTPIDHMKMGGVSENKSKLDESKLEKSVESDRPQGLTQTELQHLQHKTWVQQQMYALQSLPPHQQYQYMAAYGPYLEPNYHMHMMANDPLYRQHFEKMIEEQQKRMHMEGIPKEMESPRSVSRSSSTDLSIPGSSASDGMKNKPQNLSGEHIVYPNRDGDPKRQSDSSNEKDQKEKTLKNESQQTLKENLDLKSSVDKNRSEKEGKLSEEQAKRMQMFKEQRYIEQQKRVEQKKGSDNRFDSRPMDLASNKPLSTNNSPYSGDKTKDLSSVNIKQEPCSKFKDASRGDPNSELNLSMKSSNNERTRTPSSERVRSLDERSNDKIDKFKTVEGSFDKQRNVDAQSDKNRSSMETPKSKHSQFSKSASPHTPASSSQSPSLSSGSHYPYLYHSQFVQSPPSSYGHPFESNIYRSMVYPPNYMHASLGYPVSGPELEKSKMLSKSSEFDNIKKSDSGNSSANHKIHELQEKGKPGSRSASPVTTKSDKPLSLPLSVADKVRETNSPPTQRHVHTHHHTHVVEAAYPVYHAYPSIYPSPASAQVQPGAPIQHPPFPP